MARSVPLMIRVMIRVAAHASADTSGKTAAGWNALEPGRRMIRTPARPTAVASQRRRPTRSPRKKIDSAVTNNGETKPVADASAIGRKRRPEMKNSDDPSSATPRITCKPGRRDLQRVERRARQHRGDHDQREHQETKPGDLDRRQRRRQIFRGDIRSSEKHRRDQDQRDAAERPVGARRSGTVRPACCRARAMQLCPAWRMRQKAGSRSNSGAGNRSNWVKPQKTIFGSPRQGPKTGGRYAQRGHARCRNPMFPAALTATASAGPVGFGPRGNAASSERDLAFAQRQFARRLRCRRRVPASTAFGIANTDGSRVRKPSAT